MPIIGTPLTSKNSHNNLDSPYPTRYNQGSVGQFRPRLFWLLSQGASKMKRVTIDKYLTDLDKELFQVLEDNIIFIDFGNIDRQRATELRDALTDWLNDFRDIRESQVSFHNFLATECGKRMLLIALDDGVYPSDKVWYFDNTNGLGYHHEQPSPEDDAEPPSYPAVGTSRGQ